MKDRIISNGLTLSAHLSTPDTKENHPPFAVVLCHGFPVRGREAAASGLSFPELAGRITATLGWTVLTFNYRGCGKSEGNFSLAGWRDDILAAIDAVWEHEVEGVWLVGTGSGGSLCICAAAQHPRVRGVATLGAPADFNDWAQAPKPLLEHAREIGVIRDDAFPADYDAWSKELKSIRPLHAAEEIGKRDPTTKLFVMHGDGDDLVPSLDARAIADAHGSAELRIIVGGGHELRHDPRAVAILMGWLRRQADHN